MRFILLILVLFLLLGAAAAAGWYFFLREDPNAMEEVEEEEVDLGPPVFVEFNPIQVPVIGEDRAEQLINIIISLEVLGQENADRVITFAPRLNDAFLVELYGGLSTQDLVARTGLLDVERMKIRLRFAANRVLGEGVVTDVLVQLVSQRPL